MKKILILGAGKSTPYLIKYLLEQSEINDWKIVLADSDIRQAQERLGRTSFGQAVSVDITDPNQSSVLIQEADIVISMLPAMFHFDVASLCLSNSKPLVTASYLTPAIQSLDRECREKGIFILSETGLDPGLDHLSAMQVIDQIRTEGHELTDFESFTGGLVAPECDTNPWNYKFTWNPRNVVLAGQGTPVKFIQEGKYKYIPYHRLFRRTEVIEIPGYGRFEGYPNRDSLRYIDVYGLRGIGTMFRGTLRRAGFCRAWDVFIQLGATDDSYVLYDSENMTYRDFINSFLAYNPHDSVELKLMQYLHIDQDDPVMDKLKWLGVFDKVKIGLKNATPAQILEHLLKDKWNMEPEDRDMIVMWHKFIYGDKNTGIKKLKTCSMVVEGHDQMYTGMAKTVGLPLGIATKMLLTGKMKLVGVHLPILKEIYQPVLEELKQYDIDFCSATQNLSTSSDSPL
jgi:saccharopine dehydrogenase-like NADP-dependent oxidoreductase